jgi:hypothetical protein
MNEIKHLNSFTLPNRIPVDQAEVVLVIHPTASIPINFQG